MSRQNLDSIFHPRSIAVVGASDQPGSVGGAVFRNLLASPINNRLYAVNHKHPEVLGRRAYRTLSELPELPDLLVICTPAATVAALTREYGRAGGRGIVVISAGFREAGEAGRQREAELFQACSEFPDLRIIGPNCLGILRPVVGLNASFSPVMPRSGGLTFLSQSGALVTGILDWSMEREIGFSACVSTGNMLDVGMGDLIDYFAADEQTEALLLYIEGLADPRRFMAAARACTRRKPVLAYKSGRFAESSHAAASHTGAIASMDAVYDAAFRRAGIERVNSIEELFDCARLLVGRNHSSGNRLAIVTNAGGPGVMACDAWLARQGRLAQLDHSTLEKLDQFLPPSWSHGNPLDVLGDATPERYQVAMELALKDPEVDALLVILTPQTMTDPDRIADVVVRAGETMPKPIVASWIGGPRVDGGRRRLKEAGIPVYDFPEGAVDALAHMASSGRLRESATIYLPTPALGHPAEPAPGRATGTDSQRERAPRDWHSELGAAHGLVGEVLSKELFADYGIPVVQTRVARTPDEAVGIADELQYPVVLKVLSPDISHKTDAGGVLLNVANADGVRAGFAKIMASVRNYNSQARVEGIVVQRMVSAARGMELLLGMTRDPRFGPVILIGAGGITAELQRDSTLDLPPMDDSRIDRMLRSLRMYPLLEGYRGRPGVNLPRVREVVAKFIQMIEDLPEIATTEINPLLVTADDVIALDARLVSNGISSELNDMPRPRGPHLAIRPYPQEWISTVRLRDGSDISIQPARPGDEAGWKTWIQRPAAREWFSRSDFAWWADLPRFPERGCYLDYDREMLLVARDQWGDWCGVALMQRQDGPLNSPAPSAGIDLLVDDRWRNKGVGQNLLRIGLEIARQWGARTMEARFKNPDGAEAAWLGDHGFTKQPAAAGLLLQRNC